MTPPARTLTREAQRLGIAAAPADFSRRDVLAGALAVLGAGLPGIGQAHASPRAPTPPTASLPVDPLFWSRPRQLWLRRSATGEESRVTYWAKGAYQVDEYVALCQVLRDVRAASTVQMDVVLLNVLAGVQAYYRAYGHDEPILVNSGFRTRATNEALRSEGAVRNSMHLYGKAADITFPGIPVWHLGRVGQYLHEGGVGFYPTKHFVHVDTGAARAWSG